MVQSRETWLHKQDRLLIVITVKNQSIWTWDIQWMESWLKFDCWMRNIIVPLLAAAQPLSLAGLGDVSGTVPHTSWWTSRLAYPHPHLKHIKDLRLQPFYKLQQLLCSAIKPCVQMRPIITKSIQILPFFAKRRFAIFFCLNFYPLIVVHCSVANLI